MKVSLLQNTVDSVISIFGATRLTPHLDGGNHPPHPKLHLCHLSQLPKSSIRPNSEAEPVPANTTASKI